VKLADVRCVQWELDGRSAPRRELVPAAEVELLVEAILRLHLDPGINPHSGEPTARLQHLAVGSHRLEDGYWWTGPTLSDAGPMARLVAWDWETRFDGRPTDDEPDPV